MTIDSRAEMARTDCIYLVKAVTLDACAGGGELRAWLALVRFRLRHLGDLLWSTEISMPSICASAQTMVDASVYRDFLDSGCMCALERATIGGVLAPAPGFVSARPTTTYPSLRTVGRSRESTGWPPSVHTAINPTLPSPILA